MDKKHETENLTEYQIGNTKYTAISVFDATSQKESIEDKIKRLILQDKIQKDAKQ